MSVHRANNFSLTDNGDNSREKFCNKVTLGVNVEEHLGKSSRNKMKRMDKIYSGLFFDKFYKLILMIET